VDRPGISASLYGSSLLTHAPQHLEFKKGAAALSSLI